MINLVALPCLCVDVFDGTNEMRAGGEALNFATHASRFEEINVILTILKHIRYFMNI